MPKLDSETLLLCVAAFAGIAILLQSFVLLALYFAVRRATRSLEEQADDIRSAVMPIVDNLRTLVSRVAPKIDTAVSDIAEVAHNLRTQSGQIQSAADEALDRIREQGARLDALLSSILDALERAGGIVSTFVGKPVRQFSGILSSIKAVIDTLRTPAPPRTHPDHQA